ncbi:uncharacterized protein MONBRDRAFT_12946 [Monosiga brevicollis MX1]|uniref:DDE Tnp4 domain-containing protein n=1 Tax=Monosiga brevicollis TaxID=81824 RepID=A9VDT9_MONBE|nr:uncharacterized protein MONBRDRAFT_12946 [Monosiga brevicollis MX1]EDQ84318.1 predicted protein [Monosiga brevicollis MX1]|eukprot:XP_001750888.1 hypothetical protein [Monosiga brevicollis MX1]
MARPRTRRIPRRRVERDVRLTTSQKCAIIREIERNGNVLYLATIDLVVDYLSHLENLGQINEEGIREGLIMASELARGLQAELWSLYPHYKSAICAGGTPHVVFDLLDDAWWPRVCGLADRAQFERIAASLPALPDNAVPVPVRDALVAFLTLFHRPLRLVDAVRELNLSWTSQKLSKVVNTFVLALTALVQERMNFDERYFQPSWAKQGAAAVATRHPPTAGICAFIDRTDHHIARPAGEAQRWFCVGKDKAHALRYQAVLAPNGIIISFYGPFRGPTQDAVMLASLGLEGRLGQLWPERAPWCILGDQAHPESKRIVRPAQTRRGANNEQEAVAHDQQLDSVRVAVDWCFGAPGTGVFSRFEGLANPRAMRMQMRPVTGYLYVAVLLSNMIVCDEQSSPVAKYFYERLTIPTLSDYMAAFHTPTPEPRPS